MEGIRFLIVTFIFSSVFKGHSPIGQNMFLTLWSGFQTVKSSMFLCTSYGSTEQSVLGTYALSLIKWELKKGPK